MPYLWQFDTAVGFLRPSVLSQPCKHRDIYQSLEFWWGRLHVPRLNICMLPMWVGHLPFILTFECHCDWPICSIILDNFTSNVKVDHFLSSIQDILTPAQHYVLPHITCRSFSGCVEEALNLVLARFSEALEDVATPPSDILNFRNRWVKCVDGGFPLLHHMLCLYVSSKINSSYRIIPNSTSDDCNEPVFKSMGHCSSTPEHQTRCSTCSACLAVCSWFNQGTIDLCFLSVSLPTRLPWCS